MYIRDLCGQTGFSGVPVFVLVCVCQHNSDCCRALADVIRKQTVIVHALAISAHKL